MYYVFRVPATVPTPFYSNEGLGDYKPPTLDPGEQAYQDFYTTPADIDSLVDADGKGFGRIRRDHGGRAPRSGRDRIDV